MFHDVFIMFPSWFVEENIAWGHPSATHAEVEAAAEVGLQVNLQATWIDAMDGSDGSSRLRWLLASLKSCLRCRKAWRFSRSESMSEMPHFTWEFIVSGDDFSNMRSSNRFSWKKSPTNWFDLIPLRYGLAHQGYDTLCADDKLLSGGQRFGFPTCTGFRLDFVRSATKNRPGTSFTTRPCS